MQSHLYQPYRATLRGWARVLICLLFLPLAIHAEIIPPAKLTGWQNAGVPGGIPDRTTIFRSFSPGATANDIASALRSCPAGQVVYLSEGTYNLSGTIDVDWGSWTLRGAGMGKTILNGVRFVLGQAWDTWSTPVSVVGGAAKGSTSVTLSDATGYTVGGLIFFELDNTDEIYGYGAGGTGNPTSNMVVSGRRRDGNRVQHQMARITAKTDNSVSFWPPLVFDLETSRNPRAVYHTQPGPQFAGMESLTVSPNDSVNIAIWWQGAYGCWMKDVELTKWGTFGIEMGYCANMEVRRCYLHDPTAYDWGKGYALQLDPADTSLIIDNIFYKFQDGIILQGGASGNVIAYNCLFRSYPAYNGVQTLLASTFGNHTPYPCFNLWEGNYANQFHADYYYGPSGYQSLLRNFFTGNDPDATQNRICVNIDAYQRHYSVVGNVLGSPSAPSTVQAATPNATISYAAPGNLSWTYNPGSANFPISQNVIYRLGYPFIGNNGSGSGLAVHDEQVKTGTLIHGNWDASTKGVVWDPNIVDRDVPKSLFISAKPAWFGNLAWPPYDPANAASAAITSIPAGYRLIHGVEPSSTGNQPPVASAQGNPVSGVAPLAVSFSSAGSSDPEGGTLSFNWNFGDGTNSQAANPSHTYHASGQYSVILTVSDGVNVATSVPIAVSVTNPTGNQPPKAIASATPNTGAAPLSVAFSSGGSSDPEGATLTYAWDFGDGSTSNAANPSHTYNNVGTFNAKLVVSDGSASATSSAISITVVAPGSGLVAAYGFDEGTGTTATDGSGNGYNGAISGAAWVAQGRFGQALSFNGASSLVTVQTGSGLSLTTGMTQEAWVYPVTAKESWVAVIHRETDAFYLHASNPAGPLRPAGGATVGGAEVFTGAPDALPLNTWTHLAVTYDGALIKLYVNGAAVSSRAASGPIESNVKPLLIGGNISYGQHFNGLIDEVRIYNRALSAAEIARDMAAPVAGSRPNPPSRLRIIGP